MKKEKTSRLKSGKPNFFTKYGATCCFLLPWLALFVLFVVVPILCAVVLSFTDFDMVRSPNFVGLRNYLSLLLDDETFTKALSNTLFYAIITGPAGYIISFVVAWLINEVPGKFWRSLLTFVFYSPALAGSAYMLWNFIFSGDSYGLLNSVLVDLGLLSKPVQWLTDPEYNSVVVVVVILWSSMGVGFLSFVAGFKQLNFDLFEAGAIDGVTNRWQELWYITLPQMVPQLKIGAVLAISGAFAVGGVNAALTGNPSTDYSTHTILLHLTDYGYGKYEMGYACAIAVILFAMMVGSWLLIHFVLNRFSSD